MTGARPLFGGIEAGGTKFVLAVGHSPTEILARHALPTRAPEATLRQTEAWFREQGPLAALGIASFGPAVVDRADGSWGHIATTPKPGWSGCDLAGHFARAFDVPVGFDTDVNGAALAESAFGAGRELASLAYVTVGTGIGGGLVVDGRALHGAAHPEMGHLFPRRHPADGEFEGICPAHGDCLEGLACGPAILQRWGASLSDLPDDHEAHAGSKVIAGICHTIGKELFEECLQHADLLVGLDQFLLGQRARFEHDKTACDRTHDLGQPRIARVDPEHVAHDPHGQLVGKILDEFSPARRQHRVDKIVCDLADARLHRAHALRVQGSRDQSANPGVMRRVLHQEHFRQPFVRALPHDVEIGTVKQPDVLDEIALAKPLAVHQHRTDVLVAADNPVAQIGTMKRVEFA